MMGSFPDLEEVIQPQGQQAADAPHQAGQQRPEGWRQRPEAGEGHPPDEAGEEQYQDAVLEPPRLRERQQSHAAQHQEQPAGHRRGRVRAPGPSVSVPPRPRPPLPHQEVPQVTAGGQRQQPPGAATAPARPGVPLGPGQEAGEEEEGTGDAEEGAEAVRADAQQGPQPGGPDSPALGPRAEQQGKDKGGQGAQREARPGEGRAAPRLLGGGRWRRQQQLHVAEAAEVEEEAARGVLPQGAHAALHVAVPQTLEGRAGPVRRLRVPHGFGVSLVPPHGRGAGWPQGLGTPRSDRSCSSRSFPPGPRARGAPRLGSASGLRPPPWPRVPAARAEERRGPRHAGWGEGRKGLLPGTAAAGPPPFPSGTSRDWSLGVASQLPRAATVTSRL